MRSLTMREHNYPPSGQCLYCQADIAAYAPDDITNEHIVPRALNGSLILLNGACSACAKLSNESYENTALNNDLLIARRLLELKKSRHRGKKHNKPPMPLPAVAKGDHTQSDGADMFTEALSKDEYPQIFGLVLFPPAGLLKGIDRGAGIASMRIQFFNLGPKQSTASGVTTRYPFVNGPFAKMIAKIGYCYAVAERGFSAFDGDPIRDLLAGRRNDVYNFVGNIETPEVLTNRHLHALYFRDRGDWLTVLVHLFASCNADEKTPTIPYEVVVGRKL
jgi:hypothetical protein